MADFHDDVYEDIALPPQQNEESFRYPKSVIVGVLVLLILAAVLSVRQIKRRLVLQIPKLGSGEIALNDNTSLLDADDAQLRQQDSDQDGLSDYDELKVYGTSPFFADTDSDGLSDAREVADGTDPNCPVGQNCFATVLQDSAKITFDDSALNSKLQQVASNPAEIRKLLIAGGADPDVVNGLDDQTVQLLAQEAISGVKKAPIESQLPVLQNLDAQQIRDLLIKSGMSKQELDAISDADLQAIYQQALSDAQAEVQIQANNSTAP